MAKIASHAPHKGWRRQNCASPRETPERPVHPGGGGSESFYKVSQSSRRRYLGGQLGRVVDHLHHFGGDITGCWWGARRLDGRRGERLVAGGVPGSGWHTFRGVPGGAEGAGKMDAESNWRRWGSDRLWRRETLSTLLSQGLQWSVGIYHNDLTQQDRKTLFSLDISYLLVIIPWLWWWS